MTQCGRVQFCGNEINQLWELFSGVSLILQQAAQGIKKEPWRGEKQI